MSELNPLFTLGIGGIIAALVLYWKRIDDRAYADSLTKLIARAEERENRLIALLEQTNKTQIDVARAIGDLRFVDRLEKRIVGGDDYIDPTERR